MAHKNHLQTHGHPFECADDSVAQEASKSSASLEFISLLTSGLFELLLKRGVWNIQLKAIADARAEQYHFSQFSITVAPERMPLPSDFLTKLDQEIDIHLARSGILPPRSPCIQNCAYILASVWMNEFGIDPTSRRVKPGQEVSFHFAMKDSRVTALINQSPVADALVAADYGSRVAPRIISQPTMVAH